MAIAHVCRACGDSLTRVRAPLDPVLGLPVVVCGRCGVADVRRRHPLAVMWRKFRLLAASVFSLLASVGICGVMIGGSILAAHQVLDTFGGMPPFRVARHALGIDPIVDFADVWRAHDGPVVMITAGIWFVILGALITAALSHTARWKKWLGFIAALALFAGARPVIEWSQTYAERAVGRQVVSVPKRGSFWSSKLTPHAQTAEVLGGCMIVSACGVPLGRAAGQLVRSRQARRWQRRLAKARTRRARS